MLLLAAATRPDAAAAWPISLDPSPIADRAGDAPDETITVHGRRGPYAPAPLPGHPADTDDTGLTTFSLPFGTLSVGGSEWGDGRDQQTGSFVAPFGSAYVAPEASPVAQGLADRFHH